MQLRMSECIFFFLSVSLFFFYIKGEGGMSQPAFFFVCLLDELFLPSEGVPFSICSSLLTTSFSCGGAKVSVTQLPKSERELLQAVVGANVMCHT